ncbi:winged helix-turn-helix domain-containing protein [Pseudomonas abieticivorans]|uniref:winged helix-turn-helix domain-containing protein n=1 Tax=Pseudomonas abieticivorans TaxID=2931382 RepID=UPI0020BE3543|nr:winged helix-turn-helix domain-containing protein [Pseudomonas sp. PIA16]
MMLTSAQTRLLAVGRTCALAEDFKQLIASHAYQNTLIDTLCYKHLEGDTSDIDGYQSIFVEVDRTEAVNESLAVIETLRANNMTPTIYIILSGSGVYNKIKFYLAGADHCLKTSASSDRELSELGEWINGPAPAITPCLLLDPTRMRILGAQEKLDISFIEMKVLDALAKSRNLILSHDEIASVMGLNISFYDPRALEKSISRLRGKIKTHFGINALQSVRGYGYRLARGLISPI